MSTKTLMIMMQRNQWIKLRTALDNTLDTLYHRLEQRGVSRFHIKSRGR
jgi:hypothetical protein